MGGLKSAAENYKSCLREKPTPPLFFTPTIQGLSILWGCEAKSLHVLKASPRGKRMRLVERVVRDFLGTTVNTQKTRVPPSNTSVFCLQEKKLVVQMGDKGCHGDGGGGWLPVLAVWERFQSIPTSNTTWQSGSSAVTSHWELTAPGPSRASDPWEFMTWTSNKISKTFLSYPWTPRRQTLNVRKVS